jgi:hypothetical protein
MTDMSWSWDHPTRVNSSITGKAQVHQKIEGKRTWECLREPIVGVESDVVCG